MSDKDFFDSAFGRYVLPGIIMQSVLIGGGYATGREIVSYGAQFGALGWFGGLGIFIGFTVINVVTFEVARVFKAYDYRTLVKQVAWRFWFLYEIFYVLLAIIVIAVMASATGEIITQTIGLSYWVGVLGIIISVGLLNFYGRHLIERFKTVGTLALYSGYILFSSLVLSQRWENVEQVLTQGNTSYFQEPVGISSVLWIGILYVGYNLVFAPALFTLRRQTRRKETIWAGIIAALLMIFPWFMTYFSLMGFYPDKAILDATVPWLVMLESVGETWVITLFGFVVGWTLVETATGIIHAVIERLKNHAVELGRKPLTRSKRAFFSVAMLIIATALARIGIIDLVAKGYKAMAYGMILVYVLPLLTIGLYRIFRPEWKTEFWARA